MSFGLRVWNGVGVLRLDTRDRPMRLTVTIRLPARYVSGATAPRQFFGIPKLDPARDGVFIVGGEAGYLAYDEPDIEDGFLPSVEPVAGGAYVTWRGYGQAHNRTIRYMESYLMVLRAS